MTQRFGWLDDKRNRAILALVIAAIFFVALNSVSTSALRSAGIDFTEQDLFTLSRGTERAIENIDEPITFRLFVSSSLTDNFPTYAVYADRVRTMLERYSEMAGGKIRLEVYDPKPFSDAEDLATSYGLAAIPIDQSGTQAYFGLVGTNSVDQFEKITFFHPRREGFVEQDLTRLVVALGPAEKPVVGLITGLPMQGGFDPSQGMSPAWPIVEEISTTFELRSIGTDAKEISEDVDVLLIVHPTDLDEATLYAIDQYVLGGGKLVLFMDPLPESAPRRRTFFGMSPIAGGSELPGLLKAWGVRLRPDRVAADAQYAMRVDTGRRGPNRIVPYLVWLRLPNDHLEEAAPEDEPALQGIDSLTMASAGIIEALEGRSTVVTPIITTSRISMGVNANSLRRQPDFERLLNNFQASNELLVLAARIGGKANSAFDKRPEGAGPADEAKKHIASSEGEIDVLIVSDSDMLSDRFWRQADQIGGQEITIPTAGNADFLLNSLDHMSGANYMLGLRGRGNTDRSFTVVEEMRRAAEQRYRETQQRLQQEIKAARERIDEAQVQTQGEQVRMTEEQREEVEAALRTYLERRRQLRQVQLALRENVETLESRLKFLNIGAIPIVIGLIAIGLGIYRQRRRRRRFETS